MWNHRWPLAVIAFCFQCGGQTKSAAPVDEPGAASEASTTSTEEAPLPTTEDASPTEEAPSASPDSDPSGAASSQPSDKPTQKADKTSCAGLAKTKCKITKGCAWNDLGKCLEDEGGE